MHIVLLFPNHQLKDQKPLTPEQKQQPMIKIKNMKKEFLQNLEKEKNMVQTYLKQNLDKIQIRLERHLTQILEEQDSLSNHLTPQHSIKNYQTKVLNLNMQLVTTKILMKIYILMTKVNLFTLLLVLELNIVLKLMNNHFLGLEKKNLLKEKVMQMILIQLILIHHQKMLLPEVEEKIQIFTFGILKPWSHQHH